MLARPPIKSATPRGTAGARSTSAASWARSTGATSSSTSRPTGRPPNSTARRSRASSRIRRRPQHWCPTHPFACKRPIIDQGYYETFNRDNVTLVDLRKGAITRVTPTGIDTEQGHYDLDVIIYATGFDAMTGALSRIDVRGRDGVLLRDVWAQEGPTSYLGLAVAGFPNLFTVQGPGSPSAATNFVAAMEQHVEWIGDCIAYLRAHGHRTIEALPTHRTSGSSTPPRWWRRRCWSTRVQLLVQRRQRTGQEAEVHGLLGRHPRISPPLRRDRGRRLHRLHARMRWHDAVRTNRQAGRELAQVVPRSIDVLRSDNPDWSAASGSGARQLGEVAMDELVVTGMTLSAPPPQLPRPLSYYEPAAHEMTALGVDGIHHEPEPLQVSTIERTRIGALAYERATFEHEPAMPASLAAAGHSGPATAVVHLCRHDEARSPGWCGCTGPARAAGPICCSVARAGCSGHWA